MKSGFGTAARGARRQACGRSLRAFAMSAIA